jgi:beta-galactosidase/beta-glucuronidase
MSIPRPEHPKPQFMRKDWLNLNGTWTCTFDFGNSGNDRNYMSSQGFDRKITVPFCPESELSGIGHKDFIEHMWYHRSITVPREWSGRKLLLHFGAVDYFCEAFINGKSAGCHIGGSSSFYFDITNLVHAGESFELVLKVDDLQRSGEQAIGKQCPEFKSRACSYTRTTGIWQTVWLEAVASCGLKKCRIVPDFDNGAFVFTPEYYGLKTDSKLRISVMDGEQCAASAETITANGIPFTIKLNTPKSWSPESPFLYDIVFEVVDSVGNNLDKVESYAGLRKIHIEGNKVYLNNQPLFQRLVLDQGFYPDGIWTAPSDEALKRDIELSMAAGFNGARLHQKVFEERFHYWADKMGYLTWGESASWGISLWRHEGTGNANGRLAAMLNFLHEWREIVERDLNHPSIITWTPLNETSTPVNLSEHRSFITEIYDVTRLIDSTRPVNDTSGYCHVKTDLWTVHVYRKNVEELKQALEPENREVFCHFPEIEVEYSGQPYINDEFGGFMYIPSERQKAADNSWGYYGMDLKSDDEFCAKLAEQVDYMLELENLSGYCYTQLTDVEQEQNGIYNYDRTPKFDISKIANVFGKKR